jgi:hypothetical protein
MLVLDPGSGPSPPPAVSGVFFFGEDLYVYQVAKWARSQVRRFVGLEGKIGGESARTVKGAEKEEGLRPKRVEVRKACCSRRWKRKSAGGHG